jgi:hypothetical protein
MHYLFVSKKSYENGEEKLLAKLVFVQVSRFGIAPAFPISFKIAV